MTDLYVCDTVLYVMPKPDVGYVHIKTKEKARLTDGIRHPVIIKRAMKEDEPKCQGKE